MGVFVTEVHAYQNNFGNIIIRLTMDNGDMHYGYDFRELEIIVDTKT